MPKVKHFTPKNESQRQLVNAIDYCSVALAIGPAGTGKTHAAVGIALSLIKQKFIHRIVIARPAVGAGESNGYLPGTLEEKLRPYMQPIYECIGKTAPDTQPGSVPGYVELVTFEHMRGRTFDDAFVIVDEAQNATLLQLEMVMTRLGEGSKMIVTGDPAQCDLKNGDGGLNTLLDILHGDQEVPTITFSEEDNLRHPVVAKLTRLFATYHALAKAPIPKKK